MQPGKPPKWWFVIHYSEEALQSLESNWDLVYIQTDWKLELQARLMLAGVSVQTAHPLYNKLRDDEH